MKKRICALLLCLAALFSLAGCGTGTDVYYNSKSV